MENKRTQPCESLLKCLAVEKEPDDKEEKFHPNIQFHSNVTEKFIKSENYCEMELDLDWNEEDNIYGNQERNETYEFEHFLEAQAQEQVVSKEFAQQEKLQQQLTQRQTQPTANQQVVGNEITVTNIDTSQLVNNQIIHIPVAQSMLQSNQPLTIKVVSEVQQIMHVQMVQPAVTINAAEPRYVIILKTTQSNKVDIPQRTQPGILQTKTYQEHQVQVQQVPSQISERNRYDYSAVRSGNTTEIVKWYQKIGACICPNCNDSNRNCDVTGERQHICHISGCNKIYDKVSNLRLHYLQSHPDERLFACNWNLCNKTFRRIKGLKRHILIHMGKGKFQCAFCNIKFQEPDDLAKHVIIHNDTGIKSNDTATTSTSQETQSRQQLQIQIQQASRIPRKYNQCTCPNCSNRSLTVKGKRLHNCHILGCGKAYYNVNHLHRHLRIHTDDKPFACSDCDKKFTRPDNLQRHQRTHTDDKKNTFQCSFCRIKFELIDHLAKHVETHNEKNS